jgi:hypothetical protein
VPATTGDSLTTFKIRLISIGIQAFRVMKKGSEQE